MGWNVGDLSDYLICAGRNGGSLGMCCNRRPADLQQSYGTSAKS